MQGEAGPRTTVLVGSGVTPRCSAWPTADRTCRRETEGRRQTKNRNCCDAALSRYREGKPSIFGGSQHDRLPVQPRHPRCRQPGNPPRATRRRLSGRRTKLSTYRIGCAVAVPLAATRPAIAMAACRHCQVGPPRSVQAARQRRPRPAPPRRPLGRGQAVISTGQPSWIRPTGTGPGWLDRSSRAPLPYPGRRLQPVWQPATAVSIGAIRAALSPRHDNTNCGI